MTIIGSNFEPIKTHRIGRFLHGIFGEFFGNVIYDGTWVGRDAEIPNIDGLRRDVVEGCIEAGVTCVRWPGGCCADHYHWLDGVGPERRDRLHPMPYPHNVWRHDFGTDEFMRFCELIGAEPVLIANVATGTPQEFFDWFEYCNGSATTRYGAMRARNGHPEPYHVKIWGLGNTDENVWMIDFDNPVAYAQNFLRWRTTIRGHLDKVQLIGLGLSERYEIPLWVEKCLDHVTSGKRQKGPDVLSNHHYIGGAKSRYLKCGDAVAYSDEAYYYTLDCLRAYQKDIDLHRGWIERHTSPNCRTTLSFDEWGLWHPEATTENGGRQRQTMRDAIFAACAFHLFYRNSDIVEFAMETQWSNLLQSLFETDGARFYKTPTFTIFVLFKDHLDQSLLPTTGVADAPLLDCCLSASADLRSVTLTLINKDLHQPHAVRLPDQLRNGYRVAKSHVIAPTDVRSQNTFDDPQRIIATDFPYQAGDDIELPPHSVARLRFER